MNLKLVITTLDINFIPYFNSRNLGSGELSGKILLVRIIENNKIDDYFRAG